MEGERHSRGGRLGSRDSLVGGLVLVGLGLMFLYQNVTGFGIGNWWALFILIPAVASLYSAYTRYQALGELGPEVRGPLTGGLILLLVAGVFLLDLSWGLVWPVILLIVGAGLLLMPGRK